jgi:hypothetical protein
LQITGNSCPYISTIHKLLGHSSEPCHTLANISTFALMMGTSVLARGKNFQMYDMS